MAKKQTHTDNLFCCIGAPIIVFKSQENSEEPSGRLHDKIVVRTLSQMGQVRDLEGAELYIFHRSNVAVHAEEGDSAAPVCPLGRIEAVRKGAEHFGVREGSVDLIGAGCAVGGRRIDRIADLDARDIVVERIVVGADDLLLEEVQIGVI